LIAPAEVPQTMSKGFLRAGQPHSLSSDRIACSTPT